MSQRVGEMIDPVPSGQRPWRQIADLLAERLEARVNPYGWTRPPGREADLAALRVYRAACEMADGVAP